MSILGNAHVGIGVSKSGMNSINREDIAAFQQRVNANGHNSVNTGAFRELTGGGEWSREFASLSLLRLQATLRLANSH